MSRVDWDAMAADLSAQRTVVAQELEDIDAVLATVRQRAHSAAVPAPRRKPKRAPPAAKRASANGQRASSADTEKAKAKAKALWEQDVAVGAIAKQVGRSVGSIYAWSSEGKWKRPKSGAAAPAAAAPKSEPAGERLSGSVRCTNPKCGSWTDYDPCRSCGVKLNRKGW